MRPGCRPVRGEGPAETLGPERRRKPRSYGAGLGTAGDQQTLGQESAELQAQTREPLAPWVPGVP